MKFLFVLFIGIHLFSCERPSKAQQDQANKRTLLRLREIEKKTSLEALLSPYIDSINNIISENEIPNFLNDPEFEAKFPGLSESHNPISVRSQIIFRAVNCQGLLIIAKSKLPRLRHKPKWIEGIEDKSLNLSTYEIILERMRDFRCPGLVELNSE